MKAILQHQFGRAETLYLGETETPVPKANELLVRVKAFGLNRADIHQREGNYPPPKGESSILGLECAGIVEQSNSDLLKVGDEVFGLVPGGAYAEYVCLHSGMALMKPKSMTFEQVAAIPEAFLTAWQALVWHGQLEENQRVLIHAGASGVGNAAIQLARLFHAKVFTTASTGKISFCDEWGAHFAIDYTKQDFVELIQNETNKEGVHLIIDFIGGDYVMKNVQCLAKDGKIIQLATLGGALSQLDLRKLMAKRGSVIASTLRSRSREYQIKLTQDFWNFAKNKFETGKLKPVIGALWNWKEIKEAHHYMENNLNKGKIILQVD